jgi:hypothetical protein
MARRFVARTVHTACTDADLAWVDEFTRRTNPQIPEHAVMVWDPVVRVIRWEWDEEPCFDCEHGNATPAPREVG